VTADAESGGVSVNEPASVSTTIGSHMPHHSSTIRGSKSNRSSVDRTLVQHQQHQSCTGNHTLISEHSQFSQHSQHSQSGQHLTPTSAPLSAISSSDIKEFEKKLINLPTFTISDDTALGSLLPNAISTLSLYDEKKPNEKETASAERLEKKAVDTKVDCYADLNVKSNIESNIKSNVRADAEVDKNDRAVTTETKTIVNNGVNDGIKVDYSSGSGVSRGATSQRTTTTTTTTTITQITTLATCAIRNLEAGDTLGHEDIIGMKENAKEGRSKRQHRRLRLRRRSSNVQGNMSQQDLRWTSGDESALREQQRQRQQQRSESHLAVPSLGAVAYVCAQSDIRGTNKLKLKLSASDYEFFSGEINPEGAVGSPAHQSKIVFDLNEIELDSKARVQADLANANKKKRSLQSLLSNANARFRFGRSNSRQLIDEVRKQSSRSLSGIPSLISKKPRSNSNNSIRYRSASSANVKNGEGWKNEEDKKKILKKEKKQQQYGGWLRSSMSNLRKSIEALLGNGPSSPSSSSPSKPVNTKTNTAHDTTNNRKQSRRFSAAKLLLSTFSKSASSVLFQSSEKNHDDFSGIVRGGGGGNGWQAARKSSYMGGFGSGVRARSHSDLLRGASNLEQYRRLLNDNPKQLFSVVPRSSYASSSSSTAATAVATAMTMRNATTPTSGEIVELLKLPATNHITCSRRVRSSSPSPYFATANAATTESLMKKSTSNYDGYANVDGSSSSNAHSHHHHHHHHHQHHHHQHEKQTKIKQRLSVKSVAQRASVGATGKSHQSLKAYLYIPTSRSRLSTASSGGGDGCDGGSGLEAGVATQSSSSSPSPGATGNSKHLKLSSHVNLLSIGGEVNGIEKGSIKSSDSTNSTFSAGFLPSPDMNTPSATSSLIGFAGNVTAVLVSSSQQAAGIGTGTGLGGVGDESNKSASFGLIALAAASIGSSILLKTSLPLNKYKGSNGKTAPSIKPVKITVQSDAGSIMSYENSNVEKSDYMPQIESQQEQKLEQQEQQFKMDTSFAQAQKEDFKNEPAAVDVSSSSQEQAQTAYAGSAKPASAVDTNKRRANSANPTLGGSESRMSGVESASSSVCVSGAQRENQSLPATGYKPGSEVLTLISTWIKNAPNDFMGKARSFAL
jgi:hypothetical protein